MLDISMSNLSKLQGKLIMKIILKKNFIYKLEMKLNIFLTNLNANKGLATIFFLLKR